MSRRFPAALLASLAVPVLLASLSLAQQAPTTTQGESAQQPPAQSTSKDTQAPGQQPAQPASNAPTPPDKDKIPDPSKRGAVPGTSNDRLFFTLPDFLTLENVGKVPPL
ncbi:MAG TPA: hypothetical protein VEH49_03645, partial [Methylomirabilota bacterium]|nr:hypothetical protein [Methylomirabilota bacterium]